MTTTRDRIRQGGAVVILSWAACVAGLGCSATPVGMAMHVAGDVVNDADAAERGKEYVGAPVGQADAKLGAPVEVLRDVRSPRTWRVYRVPMDPLDQSRYVVEVHQGRILDVAKVQQYSDIVQYEATLAVLRPQVEGHTPAECEANLGMGAPRLTVRSDSTGETIQLYDARLIKELQEPHYCVLRFGRDNRCARVNLVQMYAPSGRDPAGG